MLFVPQSWYAHAARNVALNSGVFAYSSAASISTPPPIAMRRVSMCLFDDVRAVLRRRGRDVNQSLSFDCLFGSTSPRVKCDANAPSCEHEQCGNTYLAATHSIPPAIHQLGVSGPSSTRALGYGSYSGCHVCDAKGDCWLGPMPLEARIARTSRPSPKVAFHVPLTPTTTPLT